MKSPLLADIESFLADTGMGAFRFGLLSVSNGRLVEQLRKPRKNGRPSRVWPETEVRIRAFMIAERRRRLSTPARPEGQPPRAPERAA